MEAGSSGVSRTESFVDAGSNATRVATAEDRTDAIVVERVLHHGIPVEAPLSAARVYMRVKRAGLYVAKPDDEVLLQELFREGMVEECKAGVWVVAPLRKEKDGGFS